MSSGGRRQERRVARARGAGTSTLAATLLALALATSPVRAQAQGSAATPAARTAKAAALFDAAAKSPLTLRMFLREMPKGGDLHNHLGGAIYAEDFIAWGKEAGFCRTADGLSVEPPPCPAERKLTAPEGQESPNFTRLVDALSTRGWQQGVGRNEASGNLQFFSTFGRFGPVAAGRSARQLAAARRIAAGDRILYLELDHDTDTLGGAIFGGPVVPLDAAGLEARYQAEMPVLAPLLAKASAELDADEAAVRRDLACDTATPEPGCGIAVHYLFQAFRALPPSQVFRSLILAFAMADRDPRYVGINIVQPEDNPVALADYDLHMAMIRFLAAKYPKVKRTLHAGELAFGAVPPGDLRGHIAKAIDAGAQRIGHGVDIAYEDDARGTMARMAKEGIAVEINLTSNDVILGVKGDQHPLPLYRSMGVPVVLSTDDQGVLRSDMTNEYVRAAREHGLRYADLKQISRASLEYAFLPGESLWAGRRLGTPATACVASFTAAPCKALLAGSEKARLQLALEDRFAAFEQARIAEVTGAP